MCITVRDCTHGGARPTVKRVGERRGLCAEAPTNLRREAYTPPWYTLGVHLSHTLVYPRCTPLTGRHTQGVHHGIYTGKHTRVYTTVMYIGRHTRSVHHCYTHREVYPAYTAVLRHIGRHTRHIPLFSHLREAYPGIYTTISPQGGIPGYIPPLYTSGYVAPSHPGVYVPSHHPFVGSACLPVVHTVRHVGHETRTKRALGCGNVTFGRRSNGGWEASQEPQERVKTGDYEQKGRVSYWFIGGLGGL